MEHRHSHTLTANTMQRGVYPCLSATSKRGMYLCTPLLLCEYQHSSIDAQGIRDKKKGEYG